MSAHELALWDKLVLTYLLQYSYFAFTIFPQKEKNILCEDFLLG